VCVTGGEGGVCVTGGGGGACVTGVATAGFVCLGFVACVAEGFAACVAADAGTACVARGTRLAVVVGVAPKSLCVVAGCAGELVPQAASATTDTSAASDTLTENADTGPHSQWKWLLAHGGRQCYSSWNTDQNPKRFG
jgi:hypothetical protein